MFIILLLAALWSSSPILLIEVVKHGARFPTLAPDGQPTQLTDTGMRQHAVIGAELRQRYDLFSQDFKNDTDAVYIRSLDDDACIASALSQMYGIYHAQESFDDFDGRLKKVYTMLDVFPVHTEDKINDFLFNAHFNCPYTTPQSEDFYDDIVNYNNHTGSWITYNEDPGGYHNSQFSNNITDAVNNAYTSMYAKQEKARVISHHLLTEIKQSLLNPWYSRFKLYVVSDETMVAVMSLLGVYNNTMPLDASMFLFELDEFENLSITFNDTPVPSWKSWNVQEWAEQMKDLTLMNFAAGCDHGIMSDTEKEWMWLYSLAAMLGAVIVVFWGVAFLCYQFCCKTDPNSVRYSTFAEEYGMDDEEEEEIKPHD